MDRVTFQQSRFLVSAPVARKNSKAKHRRQRRSRRPTIGAIAIMPMQQSARRRQSLRIVSGADVETAPGVREQEWVRSHSREYAGKWVAILGHGLIAAGGSAREVMDKAREAGVRAPFLVHVPDSSELPFGGW